VGQRGPKPLPSNVHQLRGNASKKPLAKLLDELQPEVELPDFPSWLYPEAKKEWKRIGVELVKYGLVSKLDRAALVLYVQAWARMVWAEQQLGRAVKAADKARSEAEEKGIEYKGGDGYMVTTVNGNLVYSHHYVIATKAAQQVKWYLDLFGLSPSSRSRVTTSDNFQQDMFADPEPSDFDKI